MYCDYDFIKVTGIFNINERSLEVYKQINIVYNYGLHHTDNYN